MKKTFQTSRIERKYLSAKYPFAKSYLTVSWTDKDGNTTQNKDLQEEHQKLINEGWYLKSEYTATTTWPDE